MRNLDLQLLRRQSPAIKLHIAALPDQAVGDIVPKPNPCLRLAVRRGQPITSLIKELAAKQGSLLRRLAGSDLRCTILQQLLAPTPTVRNNDRIMMPVKDFFLMTDSNQPTIFVHPQRVGESERADAVGDLAFLGSVLGVSKRRCPIKDRKDNGSIAQKSVDLLATRLRNGFSERHGHVSRFRWAVVDRQYAV
ncbi:hypothetical protein [uncultured Roseobacter sp.]|uniref:hypothetical protein n=1 Tax=uncultured Roseobacter sp. TaxID=114847 RepID=UPI00263A28A1|nr:hypothetical protein [uncultured Roseobacter sp.]